MVYTMSIQLEKGVPLEERKYSPEIVAAVRMLYNEGEVGDSIFIKGAPGHTYLNTTCTNIGGSGWFSCRKDIKDDEPGYRIWKKAEKPAEL